MRDVVVVGGGRAESARTAGVRTAGVRTELEPLWREVLGRRLRTLRLARGERLVETAARAGISPQYLSEIERGLKEPSSEMVAAIAGALSTRLVDLTVGVAQELRRAAGSLERRDPETVTELATPASTVDFGFDVGSSAQVTVLAFAA